MQQPSLYDPLHLRTQPLAERMRPASLDDMLGQESLTGEKAALRQSIAAKNIPSMILWGPPGVGKTTLAQLIARSAGIPFFALSAVSAGVKEVREIIDKARRSGRCMLFIDEIHRFNRSQQDALLGAIEQGILTLVGATTENPSVEINAALISRCQVYRLHPLGEEDLLRLARRAIDTDQRLARKVIELKETRALFAFASGDARKLLNALELLAETSGQTVEITDELTTQTLQSRTPLYDKNGDLHYNIISAFIKSIRGSDPNAAVYYLARMVEGGEDLSFIARRMVILASEDIGNANPNALLLATATFQAVNFIGYPEARIILSQCAIYLATSIKSNSAYKAIIQATETARKTGPLSVPSSLHSMPVEAANDEEADPYFYAHDHPGNFYNMEFLPEAIKGSVFYMPSDNLREAELRDRLRRLWGEKYNY